MSVFIVTECIASVCDYIVSVHLFTLYQCVCLHCISDCITVSLHFISASVYIASMCLFTFCQYSCIHVFTSVCFQCISVSVYTASVVVAHLSVMMEWGLCSLGCTTVGDDGTGTVFFGLHTCR